MIIKILGVLDILVGLVFWIFGVWGFSWISSGLILLIGLALLVKGAVFISGFSVASILDIIAAIIIIIGAEFSMPEIVVIIVSLYLIQKGIFSLIS